LLQVIPTPLALFVISELRNLALTVRISGIIIQILLMITSKLLLVLYGKLQKAATDLAKQTGLDDAWTSFWPQPLWPTSTDLLSH
jgi:hypothetical protein